MSILVTALLRCFLLSKALRIDIVDADGVQNFDIHRAACFSESSK